MTRAIVLSLRLVSPLQRRRHGVGRRGQAGGRDSATRVAAEPKGNRGNRCATRRAPSAGRTCRHADRAPFVQRNVHRRHQELRQIPERSGVQASTGEEGKSRGRCITAFERFVGSFRRKILDRRVVFVTDDVAVAVLTKEIQGQRSMRSGTELPPRRVRNTSVLRKLEGEWKVLYFEAADIRIDNLPSR